MAELFVRPDCQHLGIGRRLAEQAELYAAERGSYKIELKVLAQNESAIKFYNALGYSPRVMVMSRRIGAA
jgi:ribosomal protein S18 acetylase RimI-like enzyme